MPGIPELLVILLIVLVVFGANKLPGIGDALGRSIKNFKRASKVEDTDADDDDEPVKALGAKRGVAQLEKNSSVASTDDNGEWEEVVVRRRKKPAAGES